MRRRSPIRRLTILGELWRFRVSDMAEFIRITESGMSSEFASFSEWVDDRTNGMGEEQVGEFIDHYYDDLAMVRDVVPRMLRYAQFLCVFGIYEHEVGALCWFLHRDGKAARKPSRNLYLATTQDYLVQHAGFRKMAFGSDWRFTLAARYLRNAIAHSNGRLSSDQRSVKARAFVSKHSKLCLDDRGRIIVEGGFCEDLVRRMKSAMTALLSEAETKY